MTPLEASILTIVSEVQGCKSTELVSHIPPQLLDNTRAFIDALENLIRQGHLVEVEYVLPSMPERVKSFLLPKGTEARVR